MKLEPIAGTRWPFSPLKHLATRVQRGEAPNYVDQSQRFVVNQACIHWAGLRRENLKYADDSQPPSPRSSLRQGDVLINPLAPALSVER